MKRFSISFFFILLAFGFSFIYSGNNSLPIKEINGKKYYEYVVGKGESLYGIANKFGWDFDELLEINKDGLNISKGKVLYYPAEENNSESVKSVVKEEALDKEVEKNVTEVSTNKIKHVVKKGETVYSISRLYNISPDMIYSIYPSAKHGIKAGEVFEFELAEEIIPETENIEDIPTTIPDKAMVNEPTPKEEEIEVVEVATYEIQDNEIQREEDESITEMTGLKEEDENDNDLKNEVRIIVLLDEPSSNKDIDFTRGALTALHNMGEPTFDIGLKVVDGRVAATELERLFDDYEPDIIFVTADKSFPAFLADYGNSNSVIIVNVFDVRNDLYEDNPSMIQILPSSTIFNEAIASKILNDYKDRSLIILKGDDSSDSMTELLESKFNKDKIINYDLNNFSEFTPDSMESYFLYAIPSKKEELYDIFNVIENLYELNPALDLAVMGRQNWILYQDEFSDRFSKYSVMIPSRVWLPEESKGWESFSNSYNNLFNGEPVKSIPNFAASGYDVTNYFVRSLIGESEKSYKMNRGYGESVLQTDFNFIREQDNGGLINNTGYIIKFTPWGNPQKIIIK